MRHLQKSGLCDIAGSTMEIPPFMVSPEMSVKVYGFGLQETELKLLKAGEVKDKSVSYAEILIIRYSALTLDRSRCV